MRPHFQLAFVHAQGGSGDEALARLLARPAGGVASGSVLSSYSPFLGRFIGLWSIRLNSSRLCSFFEIFLAIVTEAYTTLNCGTYLAMLSFLMSYRVIC